MIYFFVDKRSKKQTTHWQRSKIVILLGCSGVVTKGVSSMTEQEKSEIVDLVSGIMQKFATEYIQPQFTALQNDIDTKHRELKQEIAEVRTELQETRQEVQEIRQGLQETRQEVQEIRQGLQETRQEVQEIRQELQETRQEVQDTRQELQDTRQELKSEIQKIQRNDEAVTQKINDIIAWKRDLTDAYDAHREGELEATGWCRLALYFNHHRRA